MRKIISGRRGSTPFEFTILPSNTDANSTSSGNFRFPIKDGTPTGGGVMAFTIDWGDGSAVSNVNSTNFTTTTLHTYSSPTTQRTLKVTGAIRDFSFSPMSAGNKDNIKLIQISSWGDYRQTENQVFTGCSNLVSITAGDYPIIEYGGSGQRMFDGCNSLTTITNIANWDVSMLTTTVQMFMNSNLQFGSGGLQPDLSSWDVSNVTNMLGMFWGCGSFNGEMFTLTSTTTTIQNMFLFCRAFNNNGSASMNSWDTSMVNTMESTFWNAIAFNQDISGWDTGNVLTMETMFWGDGSPMQFNQPIGSWSTGSVTNMCGMLGYCTSFQQNIGPWDVGGWTTIDSSSKNPITGNTAGANNFDLGVSNYNSLLLGWDGHTFPGISILSGLDFGDSQYLEGPGGPPGIYAAAHTSLTTKLGTITDGGQI